MRTKRSIVQLERTLAAAQGGVDLYRLGADDYYLSHGFPRFHEELETARRDLESLGMYERCRDTLTQAEALIRQGPEHDEEATLLILETNRALMHASGSYEAIRKKLKESPQATIDDLKADPDGWAMQEQQEKK